MEHVNNVAINGITTMKEKKLVGFRVLCDDMKGYGEEIPKTTKVIEERKHEIKHLVNPQQLIGAFKVEETSPEEDGYWVCFEVNAFDGTPEGMVELVITSQQYAVLQFKGEASEIVGVYSHLHQWIHEHNYKRVPQQWTLEVYKKWGENDIVVDLCDPVA